MRIDPVAARTLLGVGADASADEVRRAFRHEVRRRHPDSPTRSPDAPVAPPGNGAGTPVDHDIGRLRAAKDVLLAEQTRYRQAHRHRSSPLVADDDRWRPYTFTVRAARPAGVYRVDSPAPALVDLRG